MLPRVLFFLFTGDDGTYLIDWFDRSSKERTRFGHWSQQRVP